MLAILGQLSQNHLSKSCHLLHSRQAGIYPMEHIEVAPFAARDHVFVHQAEDGDRYRALDARASAIRDAIKLLGERSTLVAMLEEGVHTLENDRPPVDVCPLADARDE